MRLTILITLIFIFNSGKGNVSANSESDLDFDIEDDDKPTEGVLTSEKKEQALQNSVLKAMQQPAVREQIGQVIPILRVMSPQQRLTLAALVSAQLTSPNKDQQSLNQVANMFSGPGQSAKNVTEQLLLPISMDIAKMFRGLPTESGRSWRSASQPWTRQPIELRPFTPRPFHAAPKLLKTVNGTLIRQKNSAILANAINRRNDVDDVADSPDPTDCEYVTTDMCLEVAHYPEAEILSSIRKQMNMMESFLTEFEDMKQEPATQPRSQRRQDVDNELNDLEGYMCPSIVKYAKPKRARTTSGLWKFVVNTGEYTQTLRLETCINAGSSCSYLNDNFRSICNQVYNYHRLMTWDEKRGLHMDVFKVPSCCSCHVQGYSTNFPPHDYTFAENRREVLVTAQSSSGVKREIPRPGNGVARPGTISQFQNAHTSQPGKYIGNNQWNEFSFEELPPEYQSFLNQQGYSVPIEVQGGKQHTHKSPQRPTHMPVPSAQPPRYPQNAFNQVQQSTSSNFASMTTTTPFYHHMNSHGANMQKPHPQIEQPQNINLEIIGSGHRPDLVDHLVPPGPPLPLDFERPRPSLDQRKRNNSSNRFPEDIVHSESSPSHRKRGNQRYENTLSKPMEHIRNTRPLMRPTESSRPTAIKANEDRKQLNGADGVFGSKIRGKKPHGTNQTPLFVTPTPVTENNVADGENTVRVTPKAPSKKINYNYHPIIDFFARDAPLASSQFNHPQIYPQRRLESNREWTPMLR